jgi:predicted nucleic acid-binding protein
VTDFVLDNSVTMRWCFDSGAHEYADKILEHLEKEQGTAHVPVLWRYEVSSVLSRAQNRGLLATQKAQEFLEDLAALPITVDIDGVSRILADVHQIAIRYHLTSYDAAYLELALRHRLPLATLDEELLVACRAAGLTVFEPAAEI